MATHLLVEERNHDSRLLVELEEDDKQIFLGPNEEQTITAKITVFSRSASLQTKLAIVDSVQNSKRRWPELVVNINAAAEKQQEEQTTDLGIMQTVIYPSLDITELPQMPWHNANQHSYSK